MNYLRFSAGELLFTYNDKEYTINNSADWTEAIEDIVSMSDGQPDGFMCSSSIDFPEDETDNQELIDICYAVRSA